MPKCVAGVPLVAVGRVGHTGQLSGSLAGMCVPRAPTHFERTRNMTPSKPCLTIYMESAKFYTSLLLELFSVLEIQPAFSGT